LSLLLLEHRACGSRVKWACEKRPTQAQVVTACSIQSRGAGGLHVHVGSGSKAGSSHVRVEGAGRATRPRYAGAGSGSEAGSSHVRVEGAGRTTRPRYAVVGNGEVRNTSRCGRPDTPDTSISLLCWLCCKIVVVLSHVYP
jgi:hypothetical protein